MLFVSLLAGAKTVYQAGTTLRVDRALQVAFGLPGCADQSIIADTLDAATDQDVAALRQAIEASFEKHSQVRRHDFTKEILVLDLDLSPMPASSRSEGSEKGYFGRSRSKTGRKLVRVRAAQYQEIVWEDVLPGRTGCRRSRRWLAQGAPRLREFGIVRLVQEVWAVPGRVKLVGDGLKRLRLSRAHPRAQDVRVALCQLLSEGQTLALLG